MSIGPRQQELLSYLQGLAPVGETVEVPLAWIIHDLDFKTIQAIRNLFAKLISRRLIRRLAVGARCSSGVLVVLKRLEDVA